MNIKELRIDNWILYGKKMRVQVSSLKGSGWVETYIAADGDISHYSGIPLTPEILEKAGFQRSMSGHQWALGMPYGNGTDFVLEDDLAGFKQPQSSLLVNGSRFMYMHPIRYVHELQNLFYALTGNELIIDL